jgi:hypothetical protein
MQVKYRSEEDVAFGNGTSVRVTVFWEATPYILAEVYRYSDVSYYHHQPTFFLSEIGSSRILRTADTYVQNYTASYSSRLYLHSDRRKKPKSQKDGPF